MRLVVSKYQYYICILDLFCEIKKILKNLAFNALLFLALKFSGICLVLSVLFWRRVNSPPGASAIILILQLCTRHQLTNVRLDELPAASRSSQIRLRASATFFFSLRCNISAEDTAS